MDDLEQPDYQKKLQEYLLAQLQRQQNKASPEYQGMQQAGNAGLNQSNRVNSYLDLLAKSGAQIGTTGGKAADTSALNEQSKALQAVNDDVGQQIGRQDAGQEKMFGMNADIYKHLADKQAKAQEDAATADYRSKSLAQTATEKEADRKFKEKELALRSKEFDAKSLAKEDKPPSGEQFKAGGFAKRLAQAEDVFQDLEKAGYDRSSMGSAFGSSLPGAMQSEEAKRQEQAERNFINSILRRESGAAISPSEFSNAEMQYFPRAGDTPAVLEQKKLNRRQSTESMVAESGKAYDKIPTIAGVKAKPTGAVAAPIAPEEHNQALDWAKANPNDPRAKRIIQLQGAR